MTCYERQQNEMPGAEEGGDALPPLALAAVPSYAILGGARDHSTERAVLGSDAHITHLTRAEFDTRFADATHALAVMVWHDVCLERRHLTQLETCRAVIRAGVGFDNIDLRSAGELGIPVLNVPDYGTNDVADHTFALLLAVVRRLERYGYALRRNVAEGWTTDGGDLRRLTGRRLGIVGFGRIGSAVARRAHAFGLRISFYDPFVPAGTEKVWQIDRASSLETLVTGSEIVSLHAPLTAQTRSMISRELLQRARPGLILVNTSRGELVDLNAVHECLWSGHLDAFAADVLPEEPPRREHPLIAAYEASEAWLRGRIVLTPHAAIHSRECLQELRQKAAALLHRAGRNLPLPNCVNASFLRHPRARLLQVDTVP